MLHAVDAVAQQAPRIGTISIETVDVYSEAEASHGVLYRLADKIHVETRPEVIRGFLLFKEGDPYDPARLAETERNLRALGFLKSASVTAGAPHDGVVDVTVRTQDAWSLEPGSEFGSKGGVGTYGMSFTDNNLAGTGRQASITYNKGTERTRAAIDYRDPAFFRPYWQSRFTLAKNSDGFERRVSVGRPFYSINTRWSAQFSFDDVRRHNRLFEGGQLVDRFSQRHRQWVAAAGFALTASDTRATRITAGLRNVSDAFESFNERREFRYFFVRYDRIDSDFVKLNFVNRDLRYEDFNLGHQLSIEAAVSPRASAATQYVRVAETFGRTLGEDTFFLPSLAFESRIDRGLRNAILSAHARLVRRFNSNLPQTFVARFALNSGWNLDREVQFFADGANGLRGYRLHSFEGSRNMIVNLEHRVFLGRELLQLLSPGMVAFVDTGTATNNSLLRSPHLKTDVGVGIRIGLPRSPRNLLRLDFAYPLNRDPFGRRGLLVSFSSGQAF
jgi:outer membrane translocation and assembly module TamA